MSSAWLLPPDYTYRENLVVNLSVCEMYIDNGCKSHHADRNGFQNSMEKSEELLNYRKTRGRCLYGSFRFAKKIVYVNE